MIYREEGPFEIPNGNSTPHMDTGLALCLSSLEIGIIHPNDCCLFLCLLLHIFFNKNIYYELFQTYKKERGKITISISATQINKKYVTHTGEVS